MANEYYERLSEMNPGDLADGLAMEAEFDAIAQGFSKLPTPHTGGQGFDGPVRVGDAVNDDEAINKSQLDAALGTAKQLTVAGYGDFNATAWATLPSGTYLLFGTGSQITNSPFPLAEAKTYYLTVRHAIGDNLYCDSLLMASLDDSAHADIGREAWRSGPTLAVASAGWKAAVFKSGDTVTGDILGVTAPQFANDKKFATTEFVQRALGNKSKLIVYTANATLTAADMGGEHWAGAGGVKTLTLPSVASVTEGAMLHFFGNGQGLHLVCAGGEFINNALAGSVATLDIPTSGRLTLVVAGAAWYAIDGASALGGSSEFMNNKASSGYQKLPSGLIIQWGALTSSGSADITASFPIAFPNNPLQVVVSANQGGTSAYANLSGPSKTGVNIAAYLGGGARTVSVISFIAVGY